MNMIFSLFWKKEKKQKRKKSILEKLYEKFEGKGAPTL